MRDIGDLTDEELLSRVAGLIGSQRRLLARLLRYLQEVEERRLHLRLAYSSMFDFCRRRLGMSEGEAYRRIAVARLARRYPAIIDLVESGAVYVTTVMLLRDHLTRDNHEELLRDISGKDTAEAEAYVAQRFPKPDVPSVIRKLPSKSAHAESAPPADAPLADAPPAAVSPPSPPTMPRSPRIEPLSRARFKVQFTADAALKDKIDRARCLLSHENPSMDLSEVMDRALDALLEDLDKKKRARTERPRRAPPPKAKGTIPRRTRRGVFERDGERCTFVGEDGRRCEERAFLTLDHIDPESLGGAGDLENLRVFCKAHNLFEAERVFGKAYVAARIAEWRARKRARGSSAREVAEARSRPPPQAP